MEAPSVMYEEEGIKEVRNAWSSRQPLRVSVADTVVAMQATSDLAKQLGGYVVSTNRYTETTYNNVSYANTSIVIRVPSVKLEQAMEAVRQLSASGKDGVLSESLSGQDVTSDFVDSSSRLRNLKAAEEQLMVLMENTTDLEATMSVFRELTEIRSQIEVLEGHIKFLQESSDLSSLSVEFVAEASLQPIEIGGWKPQGVVKESIQRLIRTFQDVVDFLIRFGITCLPFLIRWELESTSWFVHFANLLPNAGQAKWILLLKSNKRPKQKSKTRSLDQGKGTGKPVPFFVCFTSNVVYSIPPLADFMGLWFREKERSFLRQDEKKVKIRSESDIQVGA